MKEITHKSIWTWVNKFIIKRRKGENVRPLVVRLTKMTFGLNMNERSNYKRTKSKWDVWLTLCLTAYIMNMCICSFSMNLSSKHKNGSWDKLPFTWLDYLMTWTIRKIFFHKFDIIPIERNDTLYNFIIFWNQM